MPDIFDLGDLPSWLQIPEVDTETATRVRRYANGLLMAATRLTVWPDPIPDPLWAWAIELAGIVYNNPTNLKREQIDDYLAEYSAERRAEILAAAAAMYGGSTAPRGSFPEPDWHWEAVPPVNILTY